MRNNASKDRNVVMLSMYWWRALLLIITTLVMRGGFAQLPIECHRVDRRWVWLPIPLFMISAFINANLTSKSPTGILVTWDLIAHVNVVARLVAQLGLAFSLYTYMDTKRIRFSSANVWLAVAAVVASSVYSFLSTVVRFTYFFSSKMIRPEPWVIRIYEIMPFLMFITIVINIFYLWLIRSTITRAKNEVARVERQRSLKPVKQ